MFPGEGIKANPEEKQMLRPLCHSAGEVFHSVRMMSSLLTHLRAGF